MSVVMGALTTFASWLTLQPTLSVLLDLIARSSAALDPTVPTVKALLPLYLAFDVVIASGTIFLVLFVSIAAPLKRAEETIDQISSLEVDVSLATSGPLTARLRQALLRLSGALQTERVTTQAQLTQLREKNEQLGRLQAELVASDRLATVGKLASGVAHEVGNPLSGILGYLSVIRMLSKQPELLDVAQRIEAEVQRIDTIVRALLELGRPSRGKASVVDVRSVIDSCIQLLSAGSDFRNVQISVEAPSQLFLRAESGPLSQVIINLLINSAQAMNASGKITVTGRAEGAVGHLTVEDVGPGIAPEVLAHLFEPFFTTKPPGQGTGLGLAVSRHLLTQFEGQLSASNRPGGGACFTITLPAP